MLKWIEDARKEAEAAKEREENLKRGVDSNLYIVRRRRSKAC